METEQRNLEVYNIVENIISTVDSLVLEDGSYNELVHIACILSGTIEKLDMCKPCNHVQVEIYQNHSNQLRIRLDDLNFELDNR